jgi:hypothetical protein
MSPRYSHPADAEAARPADPADDERRPFSAGADGEVTAADDVTAPAPQPTFTATQAEPEGTVPAAPVLGPDDGVFTGPGVVPEADHAPSAGPVTPDATPLLPTEDLDGPLLGDVPGLRARWQRVQAGFVDAPEAAVGDAADLIEQTAQALVGALRQRQRTLRVIWEHGPANGAAAADGEPTPPTSDTEHLRLIMQRYRALFNELCHS